MEVEQWNAILWLSTKWGFQAAREYAIAAIDKIKQDPLDRIDIARLCKVEKWKLPAFTDLCLRTNPLTAQDARRLNLETFADLCKVREMLKKEELTARSLKRDGKGLAGAGAESRGNLPLDPEKLRADAERFLRACKGLDLGTLCYN